MISIIIKNVPRVITFKFILFQTSPSWCLLHLYVVTCCIVKIHSCCNLQQYLFVSAESEPSFPLNHMHNTLSLLIMLITKSPNANARQSQGIRLRCRASWKGKINNFLYLFSKEIQCRQRQCKRKYEVTGLSNVIIHKVRYFIYKGSEFQ